MIRSETVHSEPLTIGEQSFTVTGRLWRIEWPYGGGLWLRPTAVQLHTDTTPTTYPIRDTTRLTQLTILIMGVFLALLLRPLWEK